MRHASDVIVGVNFDPQGSLTQGVCPLRNSKHHEVWVWCTSAVNVQVKAGLRLRTFWASPKTARQLQLRTSTARKLLLLFASVPYIGGLTLVSWQRVLAHVRRHERQSQRDA